jgi:hypothetical protein
MDPTAALIMNLLQAGTARDAEVTILLSGEQTGDCVNRYRELRNFGAIVCEALGSAIAGQPKAAVPT